MPAVLIDTNVLVYAYDRSEPAKQKRALEILDALAESKVGVLSAQVLSEFFNTITRKISSPLTVADAYKRLKNFAAAWPVLDVTELVVLEAARGVRDHQLAFWDAQIWAVARLNQIPLILSEDFRSDAVIEGVRFLNPFVPTFDVQTILA